MSWGSTLRALTSSSARQNSASRRAGDQTGGGQISARLSAPSHEECFPVNSAYFDILIKKKNSWAR